MPSNSKYVVLRGLEWDTEYDIHVVAENHKGKSQPATMSFRTAVQPEAIPGTRTHHARTNQTPNSKLKKTFDLTAKSISNPE